MGIRFELKDHRCSSEDRTKEENDRWNKLAQFHENKDVFGFYKSYAEYLQWSGIESKSRRIIYDMANLVIKEQI